MSLSLILALQNSVLEDNIHTSQEMSDTPGSSMTVKTIDREPDPCQVKIVSLYLCGERQNRVR